MAWLAENSSADPWSRENRCRQFTLRSQCSPVPDAKIAYLDKKKHMRSLEELKTEGGTFSIGEAISDGWKIVSRHLGLYILGGIISLLIGTGVGLIPFLGSFANNLVIAPCFMVSAIFITWHVSRGIPWQDFGEIFKGFNYLTPVFLSSLIQAAVFAFLGVVLLFNMLPDIIDVFKYSQGQNFYRYQAELEDIGRRLIQNPKNVLLVLAFCLIGLVLAVIWAFRLHFIVIYRLDAWEAMEMSRKVATKNLVSLIGLFFLLGIIIIISALPCGIGLLFSMPLMIGALYSAFAQITGCDREDDVELDFKGPNTL